jgi:anaerobic magnesium-protoporphyrin IX monomethyl ester cyclase
MKRILLVRPPFPNETKYDYPPFGLLNIASKLIEAGCEVRIRDMANGDYIGTSEVMSFSLVAISAFSSQLKYCNGIAQYINKNNTKRNDIASGGDPKFPMIEDYHGGHTNIVVGGPGVTSDIEYAKKILTECDVLFAGDGEIFVDNIKQYYWDLPKHCVVDARNTPYHFNDVNLQFPAWNLIDYKHYVKGVGLAIETSRGCPNACSMCTAQMIHGRTYRARKPIDIIKEIKFLNKTYNAKRFYFTDDNATVISSRWKELMQLIVDADLGLSLGVPEGIQAHDLDLKALILMKKAGFHHIFIGVESGNQRVLTNVVGKGNLKLWQVEQVVKDCKSIGLTISCFFVVGLVGETLQEANETILFAEKLRGLGAYSCMVRNAIPIPGTQMYAEAKRLGYLTVTDQELNNVDFIHSGKHLLITPEWKPNDIESLVLTAKAQDAYHILKHNRGYIAKKGLIKLVTNPKQAFQRLHQLRGDAKQCSV